MPEYIDAVAPPPLGRPHLPKNWILPLSSTNSGLTPKNGSVAEPGFVLVAPGNGVINIPPVSVCHHVSTIGQRSLPITL